MTVHVAPGRPARLRLPPVFCEADGRGDAFGEACRRAEELETGTLLRAERPGLIDIALVLRPDEPLAGARRGFVVCMVALANAVGAAAPPEKPITFGWPGTLLFDGARLGGGRLGWPNGCDEDEVPRWLVFGATLLATIPPGFEPGLTPFSTTLDEEAVPADAHAAIVEDFARHLLRSSDLVSERGYGEVGDVYLRLLAGRDPGESRRLGETGDCLIEGAERLSLRTGLAALAWLDPATGAPRR